MPEIKLNSRFMPRNDASYLANATRLAWEAKNAELVALRDSLGVISEITTLFLRLYPQDDMAVLAKYHKATLLKAVYVRIYNTASKATYGQYDLSTRIEMPEPHILIPEGRGELAAGGPRFSEEPNFGIKADYIAQREAEDPAKWAEEFAEIKAGHISADRRRLPKDTEVFFEHVAEGQRQYQRECRNVSAWPSLYKADHDKYPTWREIGEQFPVLGAHLAKVAA